MHEDMQRIHDGRELLGIHLKRIAKEGELLIAALKGLHRDLALSAQASEYFHADFLANPHGLAVPPHDSGERFGDFVEFLRVVTGSLDGAIKLKTPRNDSEKTVLLEEADMTHKNLLIASEAALNLYKSLKTALGDFESFNTKNLEVGFPGANIFFDREALGLAMESARALSERAVRVDIALAAEIARVRG